MSRRVFVLTTRARNLRPGGWIELCDPCNPLRSDDGTLPADCPLSQWSALQQEGSRRFGAPLDGASRHKQCLVDAGFRNVVQVEYRWPTNPWPSDPKQKDIGTQPPPSMLRRLSLPLADRQHRAVVFGERPGGPPGIELEDLHRCAGLVRPGTRGPARWCPEGSGEYRYTCLLAGVSSHPLDPGL